MSARVYDLVILDTETQEWLCINSFVSEREMEERYLFAVGKIRRKEDIEAVRAYELGQDGEPRLVREYPRSH